MPQPESQPPPVVYECPLCGHRMEGYQCKLTCPNCGYREDCSDTFTAGPIEAPEEEQDSQARP